MFHTVSSSTAMKLRRSRRLIACAVLALAGGTVAVVGVASAGAKAAAPPLIVWIDTSRVPYEKAYMKANPHANIKWVLYNGNENGTGVLQSKFALWNRTGWPSNAPDVMFDTQNYDAVQLGTAPYNDLLNLKSYVPTKVLNGFAGTSMSGCTTPSGQIICLRNDSAAEVLWVNPTLYSQFFGSAPIPTTWQQFLADGTALNTAHPGYFIGSVGDGFSIDDYFLWANECPLDQVTGKGTIEINPDSANCTGIMKPARCVGGCRQVPHRLEHLLRPRGSHEDRHGRWSALGGHRRVPDRCDGRRAQRHDGGIPGAGRDQRREGDRRPGRRSVARV